MAGCGVFALADEFGERGLGEVRGKDFEPSAGVWREVSADVREDVIVVNEVEVEGDPPELELTESARLAGSCLAFLEPSVTAEEEDNEEDEEEDLARLHGLDGVRVDQPSGAGDSRMGRVPP